MMDKPKGINISEDSTVGSMHENVVVNCVGRSKIDNDLIENLQAELAEARTALKGVRPLVAVMSGKARARDGQDKASAAYWLPRLDVLLLALKGDLDEFGTPRSWCPECGVEHQYVRPGKTQSVCYCWSDCTVHGPGKITYHKEGEFENISGWFCTECMQKELNNNV